MSRHFKVHSVAALCVILTGFLSHSHLAQGQDSAKVSWLKVITNINQFYVVIDGNYLEASLMQNGDSIKVQPGRKNFSIVGGNINDSNFTEVIQANQTLKKQITFASFPTKHGLSSYQLIVKGYNLIIKTDPSSSVYIDGEYHGKHIVTDQLLSGKYKIKITHPEYGSLTKEVEVSKYSTSTFSRYNKNPSNLFFVAKLIPGLEYLASRRFMKAGITYGLLAALTTNLIIQNSAYNNEMSEYNNWSNLYEQTNSPLEAIKYRLKADKANEKLKSIASNFNFSLIITGAISLYSVIDGFHKPKEGYKWSQTDKTNFTLENKKLGSRSYPAFQLKWTID